MGTYIKVETSDELDQHFIGVMIETSDMFVDKYFVPGWECKHCGWRVGTAKLPPSHICPDDGDQQAIASAIAEYAKKEYGEE